MDKLTLQWWESRVCCVLRPAADALSSSSSEFGSSAKDAASGLKAKAKAAIKGATSALPNSTATLADQNADVRGEASDYRDPAAAVQQDSAAGVSTETLCLYPGYIAFMHAGQVMHAVLVKTCTFYLHRSMPNPTVCVCQAVLFHLLHMLQQLALYWGCSMQGHRMEQRDGC